MTPIRAISCFFLLVRRNPPAFLIESFVKWVPPHPCIVCVVPCTGCVCPPCLGAFNVNFKIITDHRHNETMLYKMLFPKLVCICIIWMINTKSNIDSKGVKRLLPHHNHCEIGDIAVTFVLHFRLGSCRTGDSKRGIVPGPWGRRLPSRG